MNAPVISILTLSRAKSCFLSALASIALLSGVLHAAEIVVDQPAGTGLTDNAATTTFTSTIAGSTGIAKTYTITNLGSSSGNLTGIDVVLTGAGAGNFSLDKTGLATSLTPGASTTFTVAFSPLSTGAKTAGLEIISNDADENPFNITLSGTGVATTVTLSSTGTTQTVTVPDGVSAITVEAWGGGGNGSGSPSGHGGGGGGGGAYARKVINGPLSPTYSVFVGAAGQDSTFNTNVVVAKAGSAGSATSFGAGGSATSSVGDVKRKGGDGGYEGAYNPASGGGGSASTSADGNAGQNALSNSTAGAGGAGWGVGSPAEGSGGNGGDNNVVGTAGSVPGGGGGGGGKGRPAGSTGGGAGAAGRVVLTFAAALPEIDVTGNGQSIVDGDITPDLSDHTNFGDVLLGGQQTRTYTIQNLGTAPLTLGTVGVTGSGFSVTSQPIPPVAPNGTTTFDLTFTPTATGVSSGTVSFSHNDTDENPYNFVIQGNGTVIPITVTNPVTDSGTAGQAFSQTFTQSNAVGTATFATTSTLPNGLTLGTDGTLSGTPTQTGTFPIVVTCTDSNSTVGTGSTYNLTIACQSITVNNPANTGGTAGMIFSETFMQNGAIGTATFTTTSTLPNGVTLSSSGVLSGMPTQTGSFPIVVTVTDSNNCTGTSATYNLSINCQLIAVNSPTNAAGTVGDAFSETFTQTGALGAATFTTASALPNGLTLSSSGTLSGTPTQDGTFPIVVTVTDMNNCTGSSSVYSLVIAPAVPEIAVYDGNGTGGTERTDNTGAHDFGSVNTGSSSAAQTFTIQNTGNANLTGIAVSSTSADFIVDASGLSSTLAPNATTSFTVIFSPAAASPAGGRSGVVNIASNDSDENPFEINVNGTAAVAPGAITQLGTTGSSVGSNDNTLEGYTVPAGTSRALIVTASHADEADITGVTFNGQPLTQVVELSGGPVDSIWVRAMGTSGTGTTGDIVVTRSGMAAEQQIILAAVYENVNQTTPMDSPMSSSDSSVNSSSSLTVTSEPGDLVFDLTSIFPSTAVMNSTPGAGQTRLHGPLDVTLDSFSYASWSTSTKAGAASVTMSWTSNGDYIQHVAANINIATASAPEIAVYDGNGIGGTERADNVGNVGFGSVNTGSSSAAQFFTIQNKGTADLTLGTVTLAGADAGHFSVTQPVSTTLAANATTTFTVTFNPSTAGAKSALVNIASDDGDENPFEIQIGGTGQSSIQTFDYTGGVQTYVVPAGVTSVFIEAWGAQGRSNAMGVAGGQGGFSSGYLAVTPGQILTVYVGGGGSAGTSGGYNGGGAAGTSSSTNSVGGGGGGASDVRVQPAQLTERVIVAAGGGGAAGDRIAGQGRGTGGGGGGGYYGGGGGAAWPSSSTTLPTGGTQSAGGQGGDSSYTSAPDNDGYPGLFGEGGRGGNELSSNQAGSQTGSTGSWGGGLIGYGGTYAGNFSGQSGAGGASYIGGVTSGITIPGAQAGNGLVRISTVSVAAAEIAVEDYFNSDLVDNNTFYRVPFGTADVGTTITRSFTIKNTGSGALSIGAITFDGSEFAAFAVTNPPPASIPAGGQASFDVTFTAITERGHSAIMHIVNGDADENPFDIRIGGVGTTYTGGTWTGSPALIEMPPDESFYADGLNFDTELGFVPTPGQSYTFINIQGAPPAGVVGHFNDLPDGGVVAMSFNGVIYYFQADYEGGTGGNDLVLRNFTPSDQPMWKWVSGPKSRNGIGVYGDQYEPSETNNPGARQGAMNWLAPNGNLWLFGGYGYGTALTNPPRWLNDLWEYDRTLGQWIWHSGSTTHSVDSTYGDMGTGDPANTPGARHTSGTWTDVRGNLWLYGGYSKGNWHNDLWRYDARFGEWTWVHGSNTPNAAPVRGTLGVPDAANTPGARSSVTTWFVPDFPDPIDFVPGGKLYLFGGYNGTTHYNDLWSYDISSGEWTWLGGGSLPNQNGVYGTQGVSDVANIPGSRRDASAFVGHDGCLYLFGGQGYGASGTTRGDLNDLWKFDPAAGVNGLWTWVNGSNATGAAGSYGALNTPAAGNSPPARSAGSGWVTVDGKFWLVGGFKNSNLAYNDIWTFDPVTGLWTWKQGAAGTLSVAGVYGAHGTAAAGNQPGSRFTPSTWVTLNGTLWLFGGGGADGFGNTGRMSDLWSYGIPNPLGTPLDNSEPAPFPDALIVNANPNTGNATAGTTAYVPVSGKLLGTDADGDKISFSSTSATTISQGTLTLNANGTWTYTPAYGFTGIASFQFRAADAYGGQSAIRTLVITVSTNPADSDGDGIADDYERSLWGDLASADGDGDADFDGQSNYFEFLAGTNPLSGSEALHTAPAITGTAAANGSIELQLNHVRPGVLYHLETSPDLEQWSRVGTFDFSVAGSATVQDPSPSTGAPKFYRMSLEATPAVILP